MARTMPKTNQQMLKELMSFSRFGPLAEVFVMQAVGKYADEVAKAKPEDLKNAFIAPEAWIGVAKEIQERLALHYGLKDEQKEQQPQPQSAAA